MNLSKIEKIFVVVLVVGIIVGVGIALFIVPAKDNIDAANARLTALQKEETDLNAELAREQTIDQEISDAKKSAETLEGSFYPDLTTYEAVEIVLAHLAANDLTTLGVEAEFLTTRDIELELYEEEVVVYDLKTYSQSARGTDADALLEGQFKDGNKVYTITANSVTDVTITDENGTVIERKDFTETMVKAYKQALCELAVSTETTQTVGVTQVTFDVKGKYADYLKFLDFIYDLDRATYMEEVIIPMTYSPDDDDEEVADLVNVVEEAVEMEIVLPCEDDTEVEVPVSIMFFGVEQMEELETIDASGVQVVVNQ